MLAETLDQANGKILDNNRSPARKVGEIDNRGSHFYLALYWARGAGGADRGRGTGGPLHAAGRSAGRERGQVNAELIAAQGKPVDIGGYYLPDLAKASAAMRPSATLNAAIAAL